MNLSRIAHQLTVGTEDGRVVANIWTNVSKKDLSIVLSNENAADWVDTIDLIPDLLRLGGGRRFRVVFVEGTDQGAMQAALEPLW